jgi:threonine-phosphate decarboxylase
MLHGHGDNTYQFQKKILSNFSSNVYFKGPSNNLIKHLQKKTDLICNYPEVLPEKLTNKIAKIHQLNPENILVTNGATEAIYQLALLFKNTTSDIFVPSFAEYSDACGLYNHTINHLNNSKLDKEYITKSAQVWLCNPNNPDGKILEIEKINRLISQNKNTIFIIDEAYSDFTLKNISVIDKIEEWKNLIVIRSLTKKYAIPGLRLGYIAASKKIISKLKKIKQPWSVNSLAIEAGNFILDKKTSSFDLNELINLSKSFQNKLSEIEEIQVIPSETSFFLVKLSKPAKETTEYLVNKHGMLVRNASNFRGLNKNYIRLSTQSENENIELVNALKQWTNLP